MTLEDFLKLPDEEPALELDDGMVSQKVSPTKKHSALQFAFAERVNAVAARRRLAYAFPEARVSFAGRSYVPDVAVFRWDRIQFDADGTVTDDTFDPPDVVLEIVSPGQSVASLVRKCVWYTEHGVHVALLVNPQDASVMLFRPGQPPEVLGINDTITLDEVLPDFELTVQDLFNSMRLR